MSRRKKRRRATRLHSQLTTMNSAPHADASEQAKATFTVTKSGSMMAAVEGGVGVMLVGTVLTCHTFPFWLRLQMRSLGHVATGGTVGNTQLRSSYAPARKLTACVDRCQTCIRELDAAVTDSLDREVSPTLRRDTTRDKTMLLHLLLALLSAHAAALAATPSPLSQRAVTRRVHLPTMAAIPPTEEDILRPASISEVGATALVAGTTIGAGILALPAKTIEAGFGPSAIALTAAWAYMAATALLIAEVNVNTLCAVDRRSVSMSSMAAETIGDAGAAVSSLAYAFIHYCLLVAYMLEGGKLLFELVPATGALGLSSSALFAALGGGSLLLANEGQVEKVNNVAFAGVVFSFVALAAFGASQVFPEYLAHASPAAALPALPVMVLSFTFHNVVPTVCYQLGCDMAKISRAILLGSAIPLLMFLVWDGVVLGAVPFEAAAASLADGTLFDPLQALRESGDSFGEVVRIFSLLAIVTSFIGFAIGLVDFFADLLGVDDAQPAPSPSAPAVAMSAATAAAADDDDPYGDASLERPLPTKALLYSLALLPPLGLATWDPSLFFAALDNAGTFGILTLFGIVPCLMVWQSRYGDDAMPSVPPQLPGGRLTLGAMMGGAAAVIGLELVEKYGGGLT